MTSFMSNHSASLRHMLNYDAEWEEKFLLTSSHLSIKQVRENLLPALREVFQKSHL